MSIKYVGAIQCHEIQFAKSWISREKLEQLSSTRKQVQKCLNEKKHAHKREVPKMGEALSISTPWNDLIGHQWNEEKINTHTHVDKNNWE